VTASTAVDHARRIARAAVRSRGRDAPDPNRAGASRSIGIHLPGRFGVRVEDSVVAARDGARRLDQADRALRIVA
jgi:hypothetical protein